MWINLELYFVEGLHFDTFLIVHFHKQITISYHFYGLRVYSIEDDFFYKKWKQFS